MSLFTGPMKKHVNGKKELTSSKEVVKITAGNKVYIPLINMNSTTVEVLVKEGDKVNVGTKVAVRNDHFTVPLFSSVSGKVLGIEKRMFTNLKQVDHLVIENDGTNTVKSDLQPLDYLKASKEDLVDFMMNAGIVGCGGAGFPTYIKYKGITGIHTLIINGVECEPYITADHQEIESNLTYLVTGVKAMLKMCEAQKAIIAIKKTHQDLINQVIKATENESAICVEQVPDVYPMGWERTLVYQITKQRYNKLPSEIGIIVNNATTAISFAKALVDGTPIVTKTVTISGEAANNCANVEVAVGVPVQEVMEQLGGYKTEQCYIIAGGPMMGRTMVNDSFVVHPYMNAITILNPLPDSQVACLRCGRCSDYCPSGLQPVRINNAAGIKDIEMLKTLEVDQCIECGMCSYVCPSHLAVTDGVRSAKQALMLANKLAGGK